MAAGTAPPALASEPATMSCVQTVITDPRTGVMTPVTVITVDHEGQGFTFIVRGWIDCPGTK